MEHATLMLATSQLGITICSLLILNVSEPAIHHLLSVPLHALGWPDGAVDAVSFTIALLIVSFLHVVFGEMVPKNLAFSVPDRAVLFLAPPLVWVSKVFIAGDLGAQRAANGVLRLFRVEPKNEAASTFTLDEVATIVSQSRREGVLMDTAGTVAAAVEFTDKKARDVAVPLQRSGDAAAVDHARGHREGGRPLWLLALCDRRRRVRADRLRAPEGHLRASEGPDAEAKMIEPVPAKRIHHMVPVQEDTDLEDALAVMRRAGRHLAKVRDAQGNTTAVLFLEDILEELVGEVQDATRRFADADRRSRR